MIKEFVECWDNKKHLVREKFKAKHPSNYLEIVKHVVEILNYKDCGYPCVDRIHEIDDGNYQGTLVFVVAEEGYQPSDYWYVRVSYGSCSGCDTLVSIESMNYGDPTDEQVDQYMTLALHVLQGFKKMDGDPAY